MDAPERSAGPVGPGACVKRRRGVSARAEARGCSAVWGRWLALRVLIAVLGAPGACRDDQQPAAAVVRVANWGGPGNDPKFIESERRIREQFERRHPGVRVQLEQIPGHGEYAPKMLMMQAAGRAPDVLQLDASSAAIFINNDVLLDLTPLIAADATFDLGAYFENVTNIYRRSDALYAIPLDFTPMVLYYNKALFDAAGVAYPQPGWSWDDFLRTAQALTVRPAGGGPPTQYGFNFENVMPFWAPWLWSNGGEVLDPSGRRASGCFDGPQALAAIQFLADLVLKHGVAPNPAAGATTGVDLFRAGLAAMDVKGHWMMIEYTSDRLDIGVVGLPTNIGRRLTVVYASGLAIARQSRQPQLAWEYIKYLTGEEVQVQRCATGLAISGNRKAAAHFAGREIEDAFLDEVQYARRPWGAVVERYPVCEDLGREMMEDILLGGDAASVPRAVQRTARLMDAVLAEP